MDWSRIWLVGASVAIRLTQGPRAWPMFVHCALIVVASLVGYRGDESAMH